MLRKTGRMSMISISEKALQMMKSHGGEDGYVRITIKSGGCAGMTYDAAIVASKEDGDSTIYNKAGIEVISDESSLPFLKNLTVDYSDDLISAGFRFNNDYNESSCGCGASFSVSGFPQFITEGVGCGS